MWIALALFSGLAWAAVVLVNQQVKMPGKEIMLWRGLVLSAVLLPVTLFLDWPAEPKFYALAALLGVIVGVHDFIVFNVVRDHGAGVTTRTMPAGLMVSFTVWLILHEADRAALLAEPLRAAGVVACLSGVILSMWFARRNHVNMAALKALVPVIFLTGMIDVINKSVMGASDVPLFDRVVIYALITSLFSGLVTLTQLAFDPGRKQVFKHAFARERWVGGAVLITAMIAAMVTKAPAMLYTPNPAYVASLVLTGALWVILFNRLRGVEDKSSIPAGLALLACIMALLVIKP